MSVFVEDRRGADPNLQVCIGAAPHNVPRHVCRGSIPPLVARVHVCAKTVNRLERSEGGSADGIAG